MVAVVREALPGDAAPVTAVRAQAWRQAYTDLLPADVLNTVIASATERSAAEQIAARATNGRTWLAERDGQPVGYASAGPTRDIDVGPNTGELYALYAVASEWGRGTGRTLLHEAMLFLTERGHAWAILWTFARNPRARRFYESHGWTPTGDERRRPIWGNEPEVRYRIDL